MLDPILALCRNEVTRYLQLLCYEWCHFHFPCEEMGVLQSGWLVAQGCMEKGMRSWWSPEPALFPGASLPCPTIASLIITVLLAGDNGRGGGS